MDKGLGLFCRAATPHPKSPRAKTLGRLLHPRGAEHQMPARPTAGPQPEPLLFDLAKPTRRSASPSKELCGHRPLRAEPWLSPPRVLHQPQSTGRTGRGRMGAEAARYRLSAARCWFWSENETRRIRERRTWRKPERMFGVVVVGVGRAGSVRIRDLQTPPPPADPLKLIGFVSRRELGNINEAKQISLQDALSSTEVDVAYICNENISHEEYIRQFLRAGKHVLVEYPMALSLASAQELWKIAEEKGKILHEEHIELLMEEFAFLKNEVAGKELMEGTLHFTGGPLDKGKFGFIAFSAISRLSWLVSLFGELSFISATMEERKEDQYQKMTVHLETVDKRRPLTWIEERGPELKREHHVNFLFESGRLESLPPPAQGNKNIFLRDQHIFVKKLLGQMSTEDLAKEKKRILHCLEIADEIQKYC
uniref:Biliverdin reductase A n=1 Tax=Monodelphis domestica TaxID=13616 RepID=A0A5F8GRM2_MONDO